MTSYFKKTRLIKNAGFTLIEVMIVLAILGAVVAIGIPSLMKSDNNIKKVARQFIVLGKEVRNAARLKNTTFRVAIRLDEENQAFWVESSNKPILIETEDERKNKKEEDPKDEAAKSPFQKATELIKEEKKLPKGLFFALVENSQQRGPITKGTAYIYFSPEGLVESSLIQITNKEKLTWTLVFNTLTGQADIVKEAKSLKDLSQ